MKNSNDVCAECKCQATGNFSRCPLFDTLPARNSSVLLRHVNKMQVSLEGRDEFFHLLFNKRESVFYLLIFIFLNRTFCILILKCFSLLQHIIFLNTYHLLNKCTNNQSAKLSSYLTLIHRSKINYNVVNTFSCRIRFY